MIRTAYGEKRRDLVLACGPGRAKQSMRDECDINLIMRKYQKTGAITHFSKFSPQYGEVPAIEYREALDLLRETQQMFSHLPSGLRKEFDNDPAAFLSFVQDPANKARMAELGLLSEEAARRFRPPEPPAAPVAGDSGGGVQPAPG